MLKYLPKDVLAQWVIGSVAVAGAASVAYVVVFPSETPVPDLPRPELVLTEPPALTLPRDEPAPDVQIAMAPVQADYAPSFDLVRVTDLGDVLIAGKAPATSAVAALIDEEPVAQTISSAAGEFVLMFEVVPAPMPRVLELEVRLPSGDRVRSADTLMLAPRSEVLASGSVAGPMVAQASAREVAVEPLFAPSAAPAQPQVMAEARSPDRVETADQSDVTELAARDAQAGDPQAPLAVLMRPDGSVQLLGEVARLPHRGSSGNVSIESVTYDAGGEVSVSGRAAMGSADIQIYIDNQPILRARAAPDGNWQAQLDGIERGVYRLRVDELDEAAQVTSRAEIPFERVTPEIAREAAGPQALIVQPGNTLWGMSQDRFGDGTRYMRIFDANRDQIRNPDLIYPGQVFILPEETN
ncbi:MAG: LysM peptidoglycan-binding domain-containing protein [Natronohydrobacter sp.]|nr:LysM peptidoglycan-binding domain-containing protein [Natronohydrobacter sp.]